MNACSHPCDQDEAEEWVLTVFGGDDAVRSVKREVALRLLELGVDGCMQIGSCGGLPAVQSYQHCRQAGDPACIGDILRADATHFKLSPGPYAGTQWLTLDVGSLARSARGIEAVRQWVLVAFGGQDAVSSVKREVALHLLDMGESGVLDMKGCSLPAVKRYRSQRCPSDPEGPGTVLREDTEHFAYDSGIVSLDLSVLLRKAAAAVTAEASLTAWVQSAFAGADSVSCVKREVALHLLELGEGSELDMRGCKLPAVNCYRTQRRPSDPEGPGAVLREDTEHFTYDCGIVGLNIDVLRRKAAAACGRYSGGQQAPGAHTRGHPADTCQSSADGRTAQASQPRLAGQTVPAGFPAPPQEHVMDKQLWTFRSAMCRCADLSPAFYLLARDPCRHSW
jgi:hypothetical protein